MVNYDKKAISGMEINIIRNCTQGRIKGQLEIINFLERQFCIFQK